MEILLGTGNSYHNRTANAARVGEVKQIPIRPVHTLPELLNIQLHNHKTPPME
jgi:hypothetical protein